ncbi:hypothetical protein KAR91_28635, partial [Candidatus Pacearchaeota archaeon]|nr:hypothetical protein [Candidatus Pacearchaeota archaeon]
MAAVQNESELELGYKPSWEGAIEGFVINTINRSYWRFHNVMEYEDVLQEAKMLFVELSQRYAGVVNTPQWFMSLFKQSFVNRLHNFSTIATKYQTFTTFTDVACSMDNPPAQYEELFESSLIQGAEFERLLEDSPTYVREV